MTFERKLDQAMWQCVDWRSRQESSDCKGPETGAFEVTAGRTEVGPQGDK